VSKTAREQSVKRITTASVLVIESGSAGERTLFVAGFARRITTSFASTQNSVDERLGERSGVSK
jgi:hypothetical protein